MKLYIKQKVFSWNEQFDIYDENGDVVFTVEGEFLSFGKKLHILDLEGYELAYIHQKLFTLMPKFLIYKGDEEVAEVEKVFSFFTQEYTVHGFDWSVTGDFFAHEYEIDSPKGVIACINKKWFTWGDTYEVDISDDEDIIMALCVVLVIDAVTSAASSSSGSSS